jgi:hypothetical protein
MRISYIFYFFQTITGSDWHAWFGKSLVESVFSENIVCILDYTGSINTNRIRKYTTKIWKQDH